MTYDAAGKGEGAKAMGRQSRQYTMPPSRWPDTVRAVVERIDRATLLPAENGQHLTVTDYGDTDHYEVHVDSNLQVGRIATALLFLEQPEVGGELIFPWARRLLNSSGAPSECVDGVRGHGQSVLKFWEHETMPRLTEVGMCTEPSDALRIEPRVGRLVIFFNHDPMLRTLRPRSLHGSCPVERGRKRIAQRWFQWHGLHERNALGALLERMPSWKVDFKAAAEAEAAEEAERELAALLAENARLKAQGAQ